MEVKAKILLAEDDYNFGLVLKQRLTEAGYEVTHCSDGDIAWKSFQKSVPDICLFDITMPKCDGLDLAKQVRQRNDLIPILFLTAKGRDEDKISGYNHGCDGYITKPCSIQELILRIEVFLKRTRPLNADKKKVFQIGHIFFDYNDLKIQNSRGTALFTLTQKEGDLLRFFCENVNKKLSRQEILYNVWGKDDYFMGRSMDVLLVKLRKVLGVDTQIKIITFHGAGFKLEVPEG
ncbi:response regulator transcription factor [Chitinophaga barathri]|uniref:DNA-binding response regulator n=1 Tax=Chitinophaga barathri TaxID=1647451 RepID=A0A3N4M772_9BACT|nr:response regulator transcription factor [Chitinophaga barathri]RPD39304.1 DNA-binding response regulator [Chitinophaga barathri]